MSFYKLNPQPLGTGVFVKRLLANLLICSILFSILFYSDYSKAELEKDNQSTVKDMAQALYLAIKGVIIVSFYTTGRISCYNFAKKRALDYDSKKYSEDILDDY